MEYITNEQYEQLKEEFILISIKENKTTEDNMRFDELHKMLY